MTGWDVLQRFLLVWFLFVPSTKPGSWWDTELKVDRDVFVFLC